MAVVTRTLTFTDLHLFSNPEAPILGSVVGGAGDATWTDDSNDTYSVYVQSLRPGLRTESIVGAYIAAIPEMVTLLSMSVRGVFSAETDGSGGSGVLASVAFWTGIDDSVPGYEVPSGYVFELQEGAQADFPPIDLGVTDSIVERVGLQPDNFSGSLSSSLATAQSFLQAGGWVTAERYSGAGEGSPPVDYYLTTYELEITITYETDLDLVCVTETFEGGSVGDPVTLDNTILSEVTGDWQFTIEGRAGQGAYATHGRMELTSTVNATAQASLDWLPFVPTGEVALGGCVPMEVWADTDDDSPLFEIKFDLGGTDEPALFARSMVGDPIEYEWVIEGDVEQWWHLEATLSGGELSMCVYAESGALAWAPLAFPAAGLTLSTVATVANLPAAFGSGSRVDNMRFCVGVTAVSVVRNYPRNDGLGFATAQRNYPPRIARGYGDAP